MRKLLAVSLAAALLLTVGCQTNPRGTKAISQAATTIIATVAMGQNPEIRPFLVQARPIICDASQSTNANPDEVIGNLETVSNENAIYVATINAVFAIAMAYYPEGEAWQASLQGVCAGLGVSLGLPQSRSGAPLRSPKHDYPHVRQLGK